ncbi:MAG: hypothetical protein QXL78_00145 [Methanocellales archaeon]
MDIWFILRILFSLTFAISGLFAVSLVAKAFFMTYRRDMLLLLSGFVLLIASIVSTTVFIDIFHFPVLDEMLAIAYLMGTAAFFLINASFFTKE